MGSTNSPKIESEIPQAVKDLAGGVQSKAQQFLNSGFGEMPVSRTLGFNPYEQATMDTLKRALAMPDASTVAATGYAGDVLGGKYLDPNNPALTKYADAISSGANRFLAQHLDELGSQFALAGGGSSSALANARSRATVDTSQRVGETLAQLFSNAYEAERGRMSAMAPFAAQMGQEPIQRLLQALGIGGTERQLAQQQEGDAMRNFLAARENQILPLQLAISALQGIPLEKPTYAPSEFSQNFGMAMQGLNTATNVGSAIATGGMSSAVPKKG